MASKSKKHERRRAREDALSLLYSGDIMESNAAALIEEGDFPEDIEMGEYAESLVRGVTEHLADIDERLASTSENWSVDRMPVVDRALLRLAVYEMVYVDDVPVSVAINEAVELAKAYGGEDESSRFVNGVLGRIARTMEEADSDAE
ncbi:MAG: transcription antitermination factor NusB [Eggerthellaceae bacterium]|nr:transcription antitermination factor NusB [Eggerthellaceae bacterium]